MLRMSLAVEFVEQIWIGFDTPKKIADEKRLGALLDEFVERLGN